MKPNLPHSSKKSETLKLTYRLKNHSEEQPIMEANDKKICPFCKASVKNIKIHFDRAKTCGEKIDIDHFTQLHQTILLDKRRHQVRIAVQQRREKLKAEDPEKFNEDNRKASAKSKKKSRNENPEKYDQRNREADTKSKQKRRNENPEKFDENNRAAAAKSKEKARNENPKEFDEKNRISSAKSKDKSRNQNPQKFDENNRNAFGKYWEQAGAELCQAHHSLS